MERSPKTRLNVPSWLRWPPNCCETCTGPWFRHSEWTGTCNKASSLNYGDTTDARFRCQDFQRREGA
jgi:hypothetical protein